MKSETPILFIFSGLPGAGKTTLAQMLAKHSRGTFLRIDTIEQGIRDLCSFNVQGEGYRLAYKVATDNLNIGNSVISDSCNPIELTRTEWEQVATNANSKFINIEVVCSDLVTHKKRIETRNNDIPNLKLPNWEAVQNRDYQPWASERIVIDTANVSEKESFDILLFEIEKRLKS